MGVKNPGKVSSPRPVFKFFIGDFPPKSHIFLHFFQWKRIFLMSFSKCMFPTNMLENLQPKLNKYDIGLPKRKISPPFSV